MEEEKIDIHKRDREYERELKKLESDSSMDPKDKELTSKFVWDCKIGKTQCGRTKKKLGKARIIKHLQNLRMISKWTQKPWDQITQEDMEKLVCGIEEDIYKNRGKKYSEETKADYKKTLRKFYKWLGKPDLIEFISLNVTPKDVPAITREEAETMINSTPKTEMKAGIMVLFDGGLRIEEFLNLRIRDLTKEKYGNDNDCYWIDIRYSKTFARKIPLPLCTKHLTQWIHEHPDKENPDVQLFPLTYPAFLKRLRTLAINTLKKKITPHTLRHSSATYWAPKMNRYELCAKYGWTFSSDMPDKYIKRKGIIFQQIAEKGDTDQTTKLQKENNILKEKIENLEHDYKRFRKALEYLMPKALENINDRK